MEAPLTGNAVSSDCGNYRVEASLLPHKSGSRNYMEWKHPCFHTNLAAGIIWSGSILASTQIWQQELYGVEASLLPHKSRSRNYMEWKHPCFHTNLAAGMLSVHKYLFPQKSGILPAPSISCWVILSSPALRCWTRARYPLSQLLSVFSDCRKYGVEASLLPQV